MQALRPMLRLSSSSSLAFRCLAAPLHTSATRSAMPSIPTSPVAAINQVVARCNTAKTHELYHDSQTALLVTFPVAMILAPSIVCAPFDLAMGFIIPYHMHVGCTQILEDYVPRGGQSSMRGLLVVLSSLTGLGLLKLNLCGSGLSESLKSLWREPKPVEEAK